MVDVLGTRLGRYDIRERLGKGGMAAVYKGWDTNLDRWVAVKVLHDHLADEADFKDRFVREAKVVASLNHPNIIQVYDFDVIERSDTPIYYMVMTYIPGPSLKGIMDEMHTKGERLTLTEIDNVMRGVCSALSYAHGQGMIHRDVTPGNILFSEQGQVVLADFGIARMMSGVRMTQSGMTTGTPMYMPPEQGFGSGGDHRSDIYSLGVILYEMLTGQAPYNADSAVAIIMKHINEPVPSLTALNGDLSPQMEAVVQTALAKDPADRFQSVQEMLTAYEQARAGKLDTMEHEQARTVVLPSAQRPTLQIPLGVVAGGVVVIALLLVAAVFLRPGASPTAATLTASAAPAATGDASGSEAALRNPPAVATKTPRPGGFAESMTGGPLIFKDDFGPNRNELFWPITTDNPQIFRQIENGAYTIRNTIPTTALPTLFDEEHQYGDGFIYEADFTLSAKSQVDSASGLIFRYQDDDNYYVFGINGQGQVSIWSRLKGTWKELRESGMTWTPAEGTKPAGETNHLKLVDNGKKLQGYVNGNLVIDVAKAPVIPSGSIGIYLATTSSTRVKDPLAEVQVRNFSTAYVQAVVATES